ncbi:hypothetical protein CAOG_07355 [Capsaspora owczarzaki ATCC 30864]|uniref:Uncharacterized protein n=1 Tax=Capsaspora owczarzaki (strain ATCC 30864) TaxID=595528 RepID=A0A0D2WXK9_CAPO3|nr:hypothetical protein CAOG_07355 [Capsaspora owczarzaki ATCC 30864]KJE97508.1 hypothetical protein CAOG_007355 [Capsaspora owczarzaki ATCC 30864]|eukprot:XP_004343214.1 hypothetical protein CAOG_07355 [Capsaspora owczarzaki ATCC 30864]
MSLSGGAVFVLIVLGSIALYIIGGMSYRRCVVGARGKEMFPNLPFWRKVGSFIKEGFEYTLLCIANRHKEAAVRYHGLDDEENHLPGLDDENDYDADNAEIRARPIPSSLPAPSPAASVGVRQPSQAPSLPVPAATAAAAAAPSVPPATSAALNSTRGFDVGDDDDDEKLVSF